MIIGLVRIATGCSLSLAPKWAAGAFGTRAAEKGHFAFHYATGIRTAYILRLIWMRQDQALSFLLQTLSINAAADFLIVLTSPEGHARTAIRHLPGLVLPVWTGVYLSREKTEPHARFD